MRPRLPTIRVYIAGPLFGSGRSTANVHRAIKAAERLRAAYMFPFVPHLFHLWDTISPHDDAGFWLAMDRVWLEQCDAMVRLSGESPGSTLEEAWCSELGIPVYFEGTSTLDRVNGISRLVSDFSAGILQPRGTGHETSAAKLSGIERLHRDILGGARMNGPDGPVCGCGQPSTYESGWCGQLDCMDVGDGGERV